MASEDARRTEAAAYNDTANLALVFEENIIRLIQAHDQILLFARASFAADPDRFDLMQWAHVQKFVADVSLQIVIINKEGMLAATTLGMPKAPMDLSDREHFRVHIDTDGDELFISKPVFGRVSGKWSIQLSRRIIAADGTFSGVILVAIDPYYLANFYGSIDVRKKGMVLLAGLDGIVRARVSSGDRTIGQSITSGALFRQLALASSGSFLTDGRRDGVSRISSYRRVKGYPLVVAVGFARAEVLAGAGQRRMIHYSVATFVSCLVLIFSTMIVRRQIRLLRARDNLWEAANYDLLTKLPNRNRLHEVVSAIIAEPHTTRSQRFAALLIDLDNFKFINDTLGHEAGDLVLRTAAKRIQRMSRRAQVVARLGGDEFAVVLRDMPTRQEAEATGVRILRAMRRKVDYRGHAIEISASVGIACFPDHATNWSGVFRAADLALYRAKQSGRNRVVVFEPAMQIEVENRFLVLETLRSAIEMDRVTPFYQPEIAVETGEVVGFEALSRIVLDDGRQCMPAEFMSALEDMEVGREFGWRMMEKVISDMKAWLAAGLNVNRIAINVTNVDLRAEDYAERVIAMLQENGINPGNLEIEVTETAALDDNIVTIKRNLNILAGYGVLISLDDFGTGFASLAHLKLLPVTKIKIDRSFVGSIMTDPESRSIIDAIVRLSHSLGKAVVAEGVEDEAQLAMLRELDCDIVQGFLFSRAIRFDEVGTYLLRHAAKSLGSSAWRHKNHSGGELWVGRHVESSAR